MSRLSPSTLESKETCSCFDYLQDTSLKGTASEEGTLMHKALETGDLSILETDEQKDAVNAVIVYLDGVIKGHPPETLRTIMRELKLSIPIVHSNGYVDWAALFTDNTIEFADAKFGRKGATDAKGNLQVICYVLALWERFPEVDSIRAHIVNARLKESCEPFIFDRSMKTGLEKRVQCVVDKAEDPFKRPSSKDPDLCVHCAHATRCPAFNATVKAVAQEVAETSTLPAVYEPAFLVTPTDRAKAQMLATAMVQWSEDIKRTNLDFVRSGGEIPGYRMVKRAGKKNIVDSLAAVQRLRETGTLADFDVLATVTLSHGKLSKQLAAVRKCTESEAKEQLDAVLGTLVALDPDIEYLQKGRAAKLPTEG